IAAIAFDEPRRRLHEPEVGRDPGRERCRRQRERQQESGRMFHRGSPFSAAHSIERLLTRLRYDTGMTRRLISSLVFTFFVTSSIVAQPPVKIDVMKLGPQVGQAAPDFRL